MITVDAIRRQLVAAGAPAEMVEATLWLLQLFSDTEPMRFDPRGADALAAELGTPNAVQIRAAAKQLAREFGITQVDDLCALLQQGIFWGKVLRGELVPVKHASGHLGFNSYLETDHSYQKNYWSSNSLHPGYGIILILALNWKYLTGKDLSSAYNSKATRGGRGEFYKFARAACEAVGITAPSDRTISRCLEDEGLGRSHHENVPELPDGRSR
jgi:hypothetical protein